MRKCKKSSKLRRLIELFKSQDFITKAVILDAVFVFCFTIVVGVAIFATQYEPSIYVGAVYTACLGEGSITALLKLKKKGGGNDEL